MARSLFITFEGPEGAGKTTQVELLQAFLIKKGSNVLVTRQPGGDPVGAQLRKIMLDLDAEKVHSRAELLMMMADRAQSVEIVIKPHLAIGGAVICDRYTDSSLAYQGGGRGIAYETIDWLNSFATGDLTPNLTILLDIDPRMGLSRQKDRTKMELESYSFHDRVREGYLRCARIYHDRTRIVDANRPIEAVSADVLSHVKPLLEIC